MADVRGDVDAFLEGEELVDLLVWFRDQVVTGRGNGLKKVAPLAGFDWRDEDPGGEASMLWHQAATGPVDSDERQTARSRLLTYNEDDVRATAAIRDWMRSGAITSP
jgi:predicted RecB family nuclease